MFGISQYISAFLALTLGASLWYIDILGDENVALKVSIETQNLAIQTLGDEYTERVTEYHNKKDKVKIQYVNRYISKEVIKYIDSNNTKETCENTNIVFDNIRHIGL